MNNESDSLDQTVHVLGEAMHELRKFVAAIRTNATELTRKLEADEEGRPLNLTLGAEKADILKGHAITVLYTVQLIFARLDLVDVEIDPLQFKKATQIQTGVYSKFDKARKVLREIAKLRRVRFKFQGTSHKQVLMYPVFDILPFLMLDNAVKYAPSNTVIDVQFTENNSGIHVTVSSLGPSVSEEELPHLTDKWFRGERAKTYTEDGTGFGLYFSKFICDMHNIRFEITQKGETFNYNGVPFRNFVVELAVPYTFA